MLLSAPSEAQTEGQQTPQGPPSGKEKVQTRAGFQIISEEYEFLIDPQYQSSLKASQGFRVRTRNKIWGVN